MTDDRTPLERALDVFVYAPIGLVLNADEVMRQAAERGRQSVTAARFIGQMAVHQGRSELDKAIGKLSEQTAALVDQISEVAGSRPRRDGSTSPVASAPPATSPVKAPEPTAATTESVAATPPPQVGGLAIPDYDSLAASQVVPRLAGLAPDELEAVLRYESAHRGRKTILNRIAQLQG